MTKYTFKKDSVDVINSQDKFMKGMGFEAIWGNNGPSGGFVQWRKKVGNNEVILLTAPREKINLTKFSDLFARACFRSAEKAFRSEIVKISLGLAKL